MKKISTSKLRSSYNRGRKSDKTKGKQNKSDKPEKVQSNINKRIGKQPKSKPVPKTIKANKPKVEGKTLRRYKLNLYQQKYYYKKRLDAGRITEKQFNKIVSDIDKTKIVIDKTFGISSGFSAEGKYHRKRCVTETKKVITETIKGKKVKKVVTETHLTDEYKRADKALYMKAYRRKKKINELTADKNWKKKRGNKSKRSELYKELIYINEERRRLRRECDRYEPPIPDKTKSETVDEEENVEYIRGRGVWQFEKDLNDYLTSGTYEYVDMGEFGKFKISPKNNMNILRAYDDYRDFIYLDPFATSPIVNVMIDYNTMTIFIEIVG